MVLIFFLCLFLFYIDRFANAECANACNGHGKCTSFDMCICNRNWQAADCSERICQFGLAHVDTPKGDLNHDGTVSNADEIVADNDFVYPYGTTEQYPAMQDSDLQTLEDTAHFYMECSNKGRCDRLTGECLCFTGYDGAACQRASCPGFPDSCSGHGICKTIRQLAKSHYSNVYELWDKDATMGCECDPGYFGPDCSQRHCKRGVDPMYLDDAAVVNYPIFDVGIVTNSPALNFTGDLYDHVHVGHWALRFFDLDGEDWITLPISSDADCEQVVDALESLPNNVVPKNSIQCTLTTFYKHNGSEVTFSLLHSYYDAQHPATSQHAYRLFYQMALWEAQTSNLYTDELSPATDVTPYFSSYMNRTGGLGYGDGGLSYPEDIYLSGRIYRLKFYGNPGKVRQPEVETHLDGNVPTLLLPGSKVIAKVWSDGQAGENTDLVADRCDGVTVTIGRAAGSAQTYVADSNGDPVLTPDGQFVSFLTGFFPSEKAKLKACLGGSDFNTSNNAEVYNWDYGNKLYPHLIRLVRTVTSYQDGGYYAVVYYDTASGDVHDNTNDGTVFRLLNPFVPPDHLENDNYDVYTTKGTLALTSELSQVTFGFASRYLYSVNTSFDLNNTLLQSDVRVPYDGDLSCEVGANNADKLAYVRHCLNVSDHFLFLNWEFPEYNPPHLNLYTAERIFTLPASHSVGDRWKNAMLRSVVANQTLTFMTHQITSDISTNWGVSLDATPYFGDQSSTAYYNGGSKPRFHIYKFFPSDESSYDYVAECSNRGICDRSSGVCKCFKGYTSDSCSEQSSLAL